MEPNKRARPRNVRIHYQKCKEVLLLSNQATNVKAKIRKNPGLKGSPKSLKRRLSTGEKLKLLSHLSHSKMTTIKTHKRQTTKKSPKEESTIRKSQKVKTTNKKIKTISTTRIRIFLFVV